MLIRPKHPKPVRRKPAPAPRAGEPVSRAPTTAQRLLDLQEQAGNRAVTGLVTGADRSVQRSPVRAPLHETLYNTENAGGQAVQGNATGYTNNPTRVANPDNASYDMTRAADNSGVTVLVKIRFLQQPRNSTPPPNPNPSNLPRLGQLTGSPAEIPANDPTDRRTWAATTATAAANLWTSRHISFVSVEHGQHDDAHDGGDGAGAGSEAATPVDNPIRLPVTFQAQAVFGLNEPAHQQIIVHPPSVVPGSPGQPIDSGNFYQQNPASRSASYPNSDQVIYAHEYGHLLGMPDEYSQSNEQMNAILHNAAPSNAASAQAALDQGALEHMALSSLKAPLQSAFTAAMPTLAAAMANSKPLVTRKLADAARVGVQDAAVRAELENELLAVAGSAQTSDVPRVVAFETTQNFSNLSVADDAVRNGFDPGVLTLTVGDAYSAALQAPLDADVRIPNFDDVRVDVSTAVTNSTTSGPLATSAGNEASSVVGPAGRPHLPPVTPPASLMGQLSALPATWAAAGSQLQTAVTPAAFSTAMAAALRGAAAASAPTGLAAVAALLGMAPRLPNAAALYRRAYALVGNSAAAAASQVVHDLLVATVTPTLTANVAALQSAISTEVTRILTTPPAGHAAAGPADPDMAAIVAAMKTRLDADKSTSAATPRQDPSAGGGAAVPQNVTYTAEGLMGSSNQSTVRADQFAAMVAAFNSTWRHAPREDAFTASVGGGP